MRETKEELLKKANRLAKETNDWLVEWRKKNRGNADPPRDAKFIALRCELLGFVRALFLTGVIEEREVREIFKSAYGPPLSPKILEFISKLSDLDELNG